MWWLRHPSLGYCVGICGGYTLTEKTVHDRNCHESERPVEFKSRKEAAGVLELGAWRVTNVPPVRILFDGPADAFSWPEDIRFLRYENPMPFLTEVYDAVFTWHGQHWTCIKNIYGPVRPRVYKSDSADEIVNVVRGGPE